MSLFRRRATPSAEIDRRPGPCAAAAAGPHGAAAVVSILAAMILAAILMFGAGCASPGPPRSPSLRLPEPVTDLTARRVGDAVELRFTAPSQSTDKLPLRAKHLSGVLCRALASQACVAVAGFASGNAIATTGPEGGRNLVTWRDPLPAGLATGPRRLLSYRVEFFSEAGRSAGKSEAAYTAAGASPAPVESLRAEGSRLGVVLRWRPEPEAEGTVLLRRENLAPTAPAARPAVGPANGAESGAAPESEAGQRRGRANHASVARKPASAEAKVVWLDTNVAAAAAGQSSGSPLSPVSEVLDTTAEPGVPYRYTAFRQATVTLGGRSIELRSAASTPVEFTLRETYPPPAPTGLTAAGYSPTAGQAPAAGGFAVDLIWQPVDAAGLIAPLVGYNVYRATLNAAGAMNTGEGAAGRYGERLNARPVELPAFRDTTADPANAYRYSVTSVDSKGNESSAATTVLQPSPSP